MPWRKSHRISSNQGLFAGNLFRSTSTQSNLSPGRIRGQSDLVDNTDKTSCKSPVTLTLTRSSSKTSTMGGFLSSCIRGRKNSGGDARQLTTQMSKLSQQLKTEVRSPTSFVRNGVVECRLMSKSADRLAELPKCDQAFSTNFDTTECASWKQVSSMSPSSLNVEPPVLTGSDKLKSEAKNQVGVPSVRCELVAELLDTDDDPFLSDENLSDQHLLILDCRPFVSYNSNHIRRALNVSCADCITRKRLLTGRASVGDLVSGPDDAKERYKRAIANARLEVGSVQFVVYDDDTEDFESLPATHSLRLVVSCLQKAQVDVYFMYGE